MVKGARLIFALSVSSVVFLGLCGSVLAENWWLEVGAAYRGGMKTDASGGSHVRNLEIHASVSQRNIPGNLAGSSASKSNPDSINQYGDHTFEDGYVDTDRGTGNPDSVDPSVTWNWGYDNNSQYNPSDETLTFHRSSTTSGQQVKTGTGQVITVSTVQDTAVDSSSDFGGAGLELKGGRTVYQGESTHIDLVAGIMVIVNAGSDMSVTTFKENIQDDQYRITDTYRYTDRHTDAYVYNTSGVAIPSVPHQGTYDGPFDEPAVIPSPVIPNLPASSQRDTRRSGSVVRDLRVVSSANWSARNHINFDIEADIYELWFGPRIGFPVNDRFTFHITPKVSLNYVDVNVSRSESFVASYADGSTATLNSWSDQTDKSEWIFGAGLTVDADVQFGNGYFAGLWGGYEWVSDDVEVEVGPNQVSVDVSGYTVGLLGGKKF
jgi:hypothetical protein